jgi:hypothetical protein
MSNAATEFDLVVAVIQTLEANQAVTNLFADTWNQYGQIGTAKFFTDLVDQVSVPYCLIEETGKSYQYMTPSGPVGSTATPFLAPGQMQFDIFGPDRGTCRQLGNAVASALNDKPLSWAGQTQPIMEFRMIGSRFLPMTAPSGPNVPVLFCYRYTFEYMYAANLGDFS